MARIRLEHQRLGLNILKSNNHRLTKPVVMICRENMLTIDRSVS